MSHLLSRLLLATPHVSRNSLRPPLLRQDVKQLAVKQHGEDYQKIVNEREADRQRWEEYKEVRKPGWVGRLVGIAVDLLRGTTAWAEPKAVGTVTRSVAVAHNFNAHISPSPVSDPVQESQQRRDQRRAELRAELERRGRSNTDIDRMLSIAPVGAVTCEQNSVHRCAAAAALL